MSLSLQIEIIKKWLTHHKIDGWLLYSFKDQNDICLKLLDLSKQTHITRRFFYFIDRDHEPTLICHEIEKHLFQHLPGSTLTYQSWKELDQLLEKVLKPIDVVCMEYSCENAIPTLSKIDAGIYEKISQFSVDIISSAPLLDEVFSKLTDEQLDTHMQAASQLEEITGKIGSFLRSKPSIFEKELEEFLLDEFSKRDLITEGSPICAFGKHTCNPHYQIFGSGAKLKEGDLILVDFWAKQNKPHAIFADVTKMFFFGKEIEPEIKKVFQVVKEAQKKALDFIRKRLSNEQVVKGFEIDEIARDYITEEGFGLFFSHRLGHNIGEEVHGIGVNLDSFETLDDRPLTPHLLFSCEPGIYLPDQFGIRLELNAIIDQNNKLKITTAVQTEIFSV